MGCTVDFFVFVTQIYLHRVTEVARLRIKNKSYHSDDNHYIVGPFDRDILVKHLGSMRCQNFCSM